MPALLFRLMEPFSRRRRRPIDRHLAVDAVVGFCVRDFLDGARAKVTEYGAFPGFTAEHAALPGLTLVES